MEKCKYLSRGKPPDDVGSTQGEWNIERTTKRQLQNVPPKINCKNLPSIIQQKLYLSKPFLLLVWNLLIKQILLFSIHFQHSWKQKKIHFRRFIYGKLYFINNHGANSLPYIVKITSGR